MSNGTMNLTRRKSLGLGGTRLESKTPYVNPAPRVREIGVDSDDEENYLPEAGIAFLSWRTFRVTPLLNFTPDRRMLQQYAKLLSTFVAKEIKRNSAVLVSQDTAYNAKISIITRVGVPGDDSKAVKIQVFSKDKNNSELVLLAILASVERGVEAWEDDEVKRKKFTSLPLLLMKGSIRHMNALAAFLQKRFDCVIQPLIFSHIQMLWMAAMWAGSNQKNGSRPLFLEYNTGVKELDTIQYSIDSESVYSIWSNIHDPQSNEMTEDEVHNFAELLDRHFMQIFYIDPSNFHLQSIKTTAAALHRNGHIKILNSDAVWFVLRHLTRLSQELTLT